MNKTTTKPLSGLLSLSLALSTLGQAAPAFAEVFRASPGAAPAALRAVSLSPSLNGPVDLGPVALPELSAASPALDLAPAATQSAPELALAAPQSATALPSWAATILSQAAATRASAPSQAAPAVASPIEAQAQAPAAQPQSLLGRLSDLVVGKISAPRLFDAAKVSAPAAALGIRPLPAPNLPAGVVLDNPPVTPDPKQVHSVTINAFDTPGAKTAGGVFDAGPKVLTAQLSSDPAVTEKNVKEALLKLVDSDAAKWGVTSAELSSVHVRHVAGEGSQADTIYAYFQQTKEGVNADGSPYRVPVHGAYLSFTVKIIKGRPLLMSAMAKLYPSIAVNTKPLMSDEELKEKAQERLGIPPNSGVELEFVERKVIYSEGAWHTANLYVIEGLPFMVAVDIATGEAFAWDARMGAKAPEAPEKYLLRYRGIRPLTAAELSQIGADLAAAGVKVLNLGPAVIMVEGDGPTIAKIKSLSAWTFARLNTGAALADGAPVPESSFPGTVVAQAEANDHRPNGQPQLVELPLPELNAKIAGKGITTDVRGRFSASAAGATADFSAELTGTWASVVDRARKPLKFSATLEAGKVTKVVANPSQSDEGTVNQVNMFIWISRIHDWWAQRLKGDARINRAIPVNVNISQECNAYYTPGRPSLNFFHSSEECSDTGRPGVGAHEYGHFVDDMIGGIVNGGMSEGWGDIGSMFLFGTPIIGEGFLKNRNPSWIRHGENTYQYSDSDEVHDQGQAWMGFGWKLRKALVAKLGEEAGAAAAEALIIPTMFAKAADIPSQMAQVLLNAMDKDGKIAHEAEIRAAAKAHGIDLPKNPGVIAPFWNWLTSPLSDSSVSERKPAPRAGAGASAEFADKLIPERAAEDQNSAPLEKTLTLKAGMLVRKEMRGKLQGAIDYRPSEYADMAVTVSEKKGWFSSEFDIVVKGSPKAVAYMAAQVERLARGPAPVGPSGPARPPSGVLTLGGPIMSLMVDGGAPPRSSDVVRAHTTFTAGALIRRRVENGIRQFLDQQDDLRYELHEYKRWLDSDFTLTIEGPRERVQAAMDAIERWFAQIKRNNA